MTLQDNLGCTACNNAELNQTATAFCRTASLSKWSEDQTYTTRQLLEVACAQQILADAL